MASHKPKHYLSANAKGPSDDHAGWAEGILNIRAEDGATELLDEQADAPAAASDKVWTSFHA